MTAGTLYDWCSDGTLRLWDGETGAPLATLAGHTEQPLGVAFVANGRIVSWSSDSLQLWDAENGLPIDTPTPYDHSPWKSPNLLYQWAEIEHEFSTHVGSSLDLFAACIAGDTTAWSLRTVAGIATRTGTAEPICWQGASPVEAQALTPDGILVVTLASGHVFCLQLYRGNQRITIADYEGSGTAPGEVEEAPPPDATPRTP